MTRRTILAGLLAAWISGSGAAAARAGEDQDKKAGEEAGPALPMCPVLGDEIDFFVSVRTDEGPVFFCCPNCIKKYKADPDKYAAKTAAQRQALAKLPKVQITCPLSGKPVGKKVFTEQLGQKVYFCRNDCKGKFDSDPSKYKADLANSYWYQTKCPVMGEEIDPKAFTTLAEGRKVFFCCMACDKKLRADPAKYLPNLAAQGIKVDEAMLSEEHKGEKSHEGHDHGR